MFRFQPSLPAVFKWTALVVVSSWTAQATDWPVLDYMYEIKGRGTVAGIHNKLNPTPNSFSTTAQEKSGKVPGLWSGDFLYDADNIKNRWTMVNEAKRQYEQGALVNIMWHACNPTLSEPCNYSETCNSGDGPWSDISNSDWIQLVSPCEWETNRQTNSLCLVA
jgi:mannan endo-1,4-beta-mannosidase